MNEIRRYFDARLNAWIANVPQGHFVLGEGDDLVLSTVLGSCVAACVHDPELRIGGMNHFLLPDVEAGSQSADSSLALRYGSNSMEVLINDLLRRGGRRERMVFKLFGGAAVVRNLSNIGERNAEFAINYVKTEGFRLQSHDLRGERARRVQFWPASGWARVLYLSPAENNEVSRREAAAASVKPAGAGEVELF